MLPAYAGMIPLSSPNVALRKCAPRIRGDDPCSLALPPAWLLCSPHTRG